MPAIAERITWTIDLLDIQPDDRLLEIGFGAGVAATLAAERLSGGSYTGIDRSRKMVTQATKRNQHLVDAGVVSFLTTPVHEYDPGDHRFTKVFLINVNLHLHDPARDFSVVRDLLAPGGAFYLVCHPPVERKAREYADEVLPVLTAAGLGETDIIYREFESGLAVCVVARRSGYA